jgi:hypothetical protein
VSSGRSDETRYSFSYSGEYIVLVSTFLKGCSQKSKKQISFMAFISACISHMLLTTLKCLKNKAALKKIVSKGFIKTGL